MTNGAITKAMPFITVGAIGIAVGSWLVPHNQAPPPVEYHAPASQPLDPRLFPGLVAEAVPTVPVAPVPAAAAPKPLVGAPVSTAKAAAPVAPVKAAAVPKITISMPPPVTTTVTTTPKTTTSTPPDLRPNSDDLLDSSHGTAPDNDDQLSDPPSESGDSGASSKSVKVEKSSGSKHHRGD